ncbi:Predicted kinase, aminoglycoside phosphotransferase (APT) family [Actinopolymorpha cephalotaxi]|nr:phosphotransferase [Actinopolymorpha cephalotaxi]SFH46938.1 Predicted kinase, aminoglycoside phosphotransferase (APT) family [Actinopolymorpha cephalotaxi]
MTPEHHRAVEVVTEFLGTKPTSTRALLTFGPTVVVEARVDDGLTVFVKAGANQNVHTEAAVMERVRAAGVPAVDVWGVGNDDLLPGGRWMITRAAAGRTLQDVGRTAPTIGRSLDELAEYYTLLHQIALPGFGALTDDARGGRLSSWSRWQQGTVDEALGSLTRMEAAPPKFVSRARELCRAFAAELDAAPGVLLHADLGDGEIYVDPSTGAVTAIVDWGGALVGDPLYDLVRFVGGGPADDERPAQLHPTMHARYFARNSYDTEHVQRMLAFYRFHICVVEAAWGADLAGWTAGHVAWAQHLMDELGG